MGTYALAANGDRPAITAAPETELAALTTCPQTVRWHGEGDVGRHTELVCAEMENLIAGDPDRFDDTSTLVCRLAAVLHDIGKPATTRPGDEPDCWHAHGHAHTGAKITSLLFATDPYLSSQPPEVAAAVHALVRNHMWTYHPERVSPGAAIRAAHLVDPALLVTLWRADTRGRVCDDADALADQVDFAEAWLADLGADRLSPWPHIDAVCAPADLEPRVRREALRAVVDGRVGDPGAAGAYIAARERATGGGSLTYTIGLPGSGKSTWAQRWASRTGGVVLSADANRRRDRSAAHAVVRERLVAELRAGNDVCVDATHVTRDSRDRLLAVAETYAASVHAVYVDTPLAACLRRQQTRPWREAVPTDVVERMRRELRWPTPDEYATFTIVTADAERPAGPFAS